MAKEDGDLLSMEEANGLIGRGPDGPGIAEGQELKVTYTWRGIVRRYRLVAFYTNKSKPALLRAE